MRLGFNAPLKPAPVPPAEEPCWVNGEKIRDFPWSRAPPYRILEQDGQAHVLRDRDSRTTGYLVFNSPRQSGNTVLHSVNRPCSVMVKETSQGLRLSVASTEMNSWLREIKDLPHDQQHASRQAARQLQNAGSGEIVVTDVRRAAAGCAVRSRRLHPAVEE